MDLSFKYMRKFFYSTLAISSVMFTSCLPDSLPVDDIPQLKPKIVVSSQILPDQSVVIFLTKSVGALDASDSSDPEELLQQIAINDAVVIIYNDELSDTLTFIGNGLYSGNSIDFQEEETYWLKVESPSMGSVSSSTEVKTQVLFESVEGRIYDNGYDTLADIEYSFVDPPGKNYYMVNVQRYYSELEVEDLLNPRIFTHLETDTGFDGQLRYNEILVFGGRDFFPGDTVGVFLSNISQPYYDFIEVRLDSRFNFADFLGEPANYPTNINGGLGFFNLHIPDVRILVLEE